MRNACALGHNKKLLERINTLGVQTKTGLDYNYSHNFERADVDVSSSDYRRLGSGLLLGSMETRIVEYHCMRRASSLVTLIPMQECTLSGIKTIALHGTAYYV